jgi:Fe-S cluster biogenesis protein NfuA
VTDVATKASDKPKTDVQTAGTAAAASDAGVVGSVTKALSEFVAALVRADGGELYLTGTCAGCPGATMTRERLLEPAVHGAAPKARVTVTTGWTVPDGARKVE